MKAAHTMSLQRTALVRRIRAAADLHRYAAWRVMDG